MSLIIENYVKDVYIKAGFNVIEVKLYKSICLLEVTIKIPCGEHTFLHSTSTWKQLHEDASVWNEQSQWCNFPEND